MQYHITIFSVELYCCLGGSSWRWDALYT